MKLRIIHSDGSNQTLDINGSSTSFGRDDGCDVRFDTQRYPTVSGIHAELNLNNRIWTLKHRSKSNPTLLNGAAVPSSAAVKVGSKIRLGATGPTIEIIQLDDSARPAATMIGEDVSAILESLSESQRFSINDGGIIGRDANGSDFVLDHPHVSRTHAQILADGRRFKIADLSSANGTFLNGNRITSSVALSNGDVVDIGPYSLEFDGTHLSTLSRANNVQLVAMGLSYEVSDSSKQKLTLLNRIDLVLNPGEFLCILGPSGSGKSTLLNQLSGRRTPTAGQVYINSRDLHLNFGALKQDVAVMPQSSVMHESLSVDETLRYTAALRLPPDLNSDEISESVDTMLETVGLTERRDVAIRQLSGGQLKRAGLGAELMSEPSLLFLDEVTSGLDEHSDGEMMRLFRSLANSGKTVVCITHNLAHVEENCHLLAVLTVGGRLAFYGSPAEAKKYFKVRTLADIYTRLESHEPKKWAHHFMRSGEFRRYIAQRKPAPQTLSAGSESAIDKQPASVFRQYSVLLRRTIAVWRSDPQALIAMFGQAVLVAFLLCLVFGRLDEGDAGTPIERSNKIRNLLFLVGVSSFWLGCNNCVKELVKERPIFIRERDFNLIPESYLFAKLSFLATIGLIQSIMLGAIALGWFGMPGERLPMLAGIAALSMAGTTVGLAISSIAKSEETAVAFVPIFIIPQIILTGVVASLSAVPEFIAKATITVYWGQKVLEHFLPTEDKIPSDFSPNAAMCFTVIGIHAMAFLIVAWFGVRKTA